MVIAIGPAVILALWGVAYFRACLLTLTGANESPIEYRYTTKAGDLKLRVESWQIDLRRNFIRASDITIREPDSRLLASAKEVSLYGVLPFVTSGPKEPIRGLARDVYMRLERLPNGHLRVEDFVPVKKEAPSNIPYSVQVDNTRILFEDRSSPTAWKRWLSAPRVVVEGVGDTLDAFGRLKIQDVGYVQADAVKNDLGLTVSATADHVDMAPLLKHIVDTPDIRRALELKNVQVASAVVSGPIKVLVSPKGEVRFLGDIESDARAVSYQTKYAADTAHFKGIVTESGLNGTLSATSREGAHVVYDGALDWSKQTTVGGKIDVDLPGAQSLPAFLRGSLPKDSNFQQGRFVGWLSYSSGQGVRVDGEARAARATYTKERIDNPVLGLSGTSAGVSVLVKGGTWAGTPIHGSVAYDVSKKSLAGVLRADHVSVGAVARHFNVQTVDGTANVQAIVEGSTNDPRVTFRGSGKGATRVGKERFDLGNVGLDASYQNGILDLTRLSIEGPSGIFTAKGTWKRKPDILDIDVLGNSVPLTAINKDLTGTATFTGKVTGKSGDPVGVGRGEAYAIKFNDQAIPIVMADLTVTKKDLQAKNMIAFKGAAQAKGDISLSFADLVLSGYLSASGVQIGDYLNDKVSGILSVPQAKLAGTLNDPIISGTVLGQNLVAQKVKVDSLTATGTLHGKSLDVANAVAQLQQGRINGSGTYDLGTSEGSFKATAEDIPLDDLSSTISDTALIAGKINGTLTGKIADQKLTEFQSTGDLMSVTVNDVLLGGGPFTVQSFNNKWSGSLFMGNLDRFIELPNFVFDPNANTIESDLNLHGIAIENLYSATKRYFTAGPNTKPLFEIPDSVAVRLADLAGMIDSSVKLKGDPQNPDVDISSLDLTSLVFQGKKSGEIKGVAKRTNQVWDIKSLSWTGGPGALTASGTIAEHGEVKLDGEINNLNADYLALFDANLARFTGKTNIPFRVSGESKSPIIDASLDYREGEEGAADRRQVNVVAQIKEGSIDASGSYFINGFTGPVIANLPFEYPFTIPSDKPITAKLSLPERQLADLIELFPWIDKSRTQGTISGEALVSGHLGDLKVTGGVQASAPVFASTTFDTFMRDLKATANFNGTDLSLDASATSSEGGSIAIQHAKLGLGNFSDAIQMSLDELLRNTVSGTVTLNDLKVKHKNRSKEEGGDINAVFQGHVDVSGQLRRPTVAGDLTWLSGSLNMPSAFPASTEGSTPVINPRFNVALNIANPVHLASGTGSFDLIGSGQLAGSMTVPDLNATLLVAKGSIRLPNARIAIEPGGEIRLSYRGAQFGGSTARADLSLTGHTALTAESYTGAGAERYDITLDITGNLLEDGGLQLNATSDPPGLSSDRIMTLLGQGDILAGRPGTYTSVNPARQVQTALMNIGLPTLFGSFTDQLSRQLGFDINVDYNPFDQLSVSASLPIGKDFMLTGRRQLSSPAPGQRLQYDVRLTYRLPFKAKVLDRLRLSVGFDQDRPWKIGVEYGFRF